MKKTCEIKEIANSKLTSLYDLYFFLIEIYQTIGKILEIKEIPNFKCVLV